MNKYVLFGISLVNLIHAAEGKSDFKRSALINAPNFFVTGIAQKGVEGILGKPDFVDDKNRCWYRWRENDKNKFRPDNDEVYSRFTYSKGILFKAELVRVKTEQTKIKLKGTSG